MTTPDAQTINDHFEPMGELVFEQENGRRLTVQTFECKSCGSLISVREKHWEVHQAIPTIKFEG